MNPPVPDDGRDTTDDGDPSGMKRTAAVVPVASSLSLSEFIHRQLSVLIDTGNSTTGTNRNTDSSDGSNYSRSATGTTKVQHVRSHLLPYFQSGTTNTTTNSTSTTTSTISSTKKKPTTDAYITFYGSTHQAHLPSIPNWNTSFRKSYSVLLWLRVRVEAGEGGGGGGGVRGETLPVVTETTHDTTTTTHTTTTSSSSSLNDTTKRILYRFSSSPLLEEPNVDHGTGVCVTASQWKLLPETTTTGSTTTSTGSATDTNNNNTTNNNNNTPPRQLQTTLTAYALPYHHTTAAEASNFLLGATGTSSQQRRRRGGDHPPPHQQQQQQNHHNYASYTQQLLTLNENQWHLIGCTHIYPYLKRPVWTVCVDGAMAGSNSNATTDHHQNELQYPVLSDLHVGHRNSNSRSTSNSSIPSHLRSMEYCTILQNITAGGAICLPSHPPDDHPPPKTDDAKTASELVQEQHLLQQHPTIPICCDLAAISIYPEPISPVVQAVLAEAGPTLVQQKLGRIVTPLPPIANWCKGCSLAGGPKVGIPLTVHNASLDLQQLSGAVHFAASIPDTRVLGGGTSTTGSTTTRTTDPITTTTTRLSCPFRSMAGKTDTAPRVGLIQPEPTMTIPNHHGTNNTMDDDTPVLYVTGQCSLVHTLRQYCQGEFPTTKNNTDTDHDTTTAIESILQYSTNNFSMAWMEQQIITMIVLPFFLAIPPTTVEVKFGNQNRVVTDSYIHLYDLYSQQAAYAVSLLQLFMAVVQMGGAAIQEEILQNGIIHVLSVSIRHGLIRAIKLKLYPNCNNYTEFIQRVPKLEEQLQHSNITTISPSYIPPLLVETMVQLIDVCCGPPAPMIDELSPAMQIRRTSDLALTALFGFALDFDIWSSDVFAASTIFQAVADRYGCVGCVTTGYVLRCHVSVQHLLDQIRCLRFDHYLSSSFGTTGPATTQPPTRSEKHVAAVESVATSLSRILQSMVLSSLSNHQSIAKGEKDISACIGALCDCPLGSVTAHIVLSALIGILIWCEIIPPEANPSIVIEPSNDDEHKVEVASRLGRNLLVALFHEVVAPVLLSRTVFSGESSSSSSNVSSISAAGTSRSSLLCWQNHWRLNLLIFSWIASIAGPEGIITSRSTGGLVLASSLAGSLDGALDDAEQNILATLFMPSPAMALLIGATLRNEWSYKDLIAERLQVMIPMLPGMVVSLLTHPSNAISNTTMSVKSLRVLAEILTAVVGSFHRVFDGIVHSSGHQSVKTRNNASSEAIKAAKSYVPHLMVVVMILENHIAMRPTVAADDYVEQLPSPRSAQMLNARSTSDTRTDPETSDTADLTNQLFLLVPSESQIDVPVLVEFLRLCQMSVLGTACGFLSNAMRLGGAGAALPLWSSVLATLDDSVAYAVSIRSAVDSVAQTQPDSLQHNDDNIYPQNSEQTPEEDVSEIVNHVEDQWATTLAQNVLCRTIALVLLKSLSNEQQLHVWGYELCASVSKLITLIDEKGLVSKALSTTDVGTSHFSKDQLFLLRSLLDILQYGREISGWCQLRLPSMATDTKSGKPVADMNTNSKLMLPILSPCLRLVLVALGHVKPFVKTLHASPSPADVNEGQSLFDRTLVELDRTLTASIVGTNFASARDVALHAMSTLRELAATCRGNGDEITSERYQSLFIKVAIELRFRYQNERRLRNTALFDAYEEAGSTGSGIQAANESLAVERLILGNEGIGDASNIVDTSNSYTEEIVFNSPAKVAPVKTSVDFVLFHEPIEGQDAGGKVAFSDIKGLGAVLEECDLSNSNTDTFTTFDNISTALSAYLNTWDTLSPEVGVNSEIGKVFDTNVNSKSPARSLQSRQLPFIGSDSAADAMSTFFEFSAGEKSRIQELSVRFFPSQRSSRRAFAERFCWARYMEIASFSIESHWERAVPDGNRDVRSRLPTTPCFPQFRRSLPKYLDDSSEDNVTEAIVPADLPAKAGRRASMTPLEMDTLTKSLLETGRLEIVDITKKEISEEELLDPMQTSVTDIGDGEEVAYGSEKDSDGVVSPQSQTDIAISQSSDMDYDFEQPISANAMSQSEITTELSDKWHHSITASSFSTPPDNSSSSLSLMHSAAAGHIERHVENCTHVKAEGNRQCTLLLTSSHLILEYDSNTDGLYEGEILAIQEDMDRQRRMTADVPSTSTNEQSHEAMTQQLDDKRQSEIASLRPKSIKWNLSEVSHVYLRRYRLRDSSLELFVIPTGGTSFGGFGLFSPSSSLFLDFGSGHEATVKRDEAAKAIMRRVPPQAIKQWPDSSEEFLRDQLSRLTVGWVEGRVTNFDYLLHLNILAGRSYNDTCQYPVFPWVLADYSSNEVPDLTDRKNFRDLAKPVGALNPDRLKDFIERFNTFADPSIPPFMYGSHYSTSAGVVLHFLVRMHPFAGLHRQLQGGHFDVADRLFSSIPRTWSMCTGSSAAEVKELTPEWYCNPSFLRNENLFKLGTSQDGEVMGDVILPRWAKGSPEKFIEVMRAALESDVCSEMLSDWIDLVFGRKQQGQESVKAHNVFFYLTYYGTVDVASIEDEALRKATELQIAHFGQCPMQLFKRPHIRRLPQDYFNLSIYQLFSAYTQRQLVVQQIESSEKGDLDKRNTTTLERARLHCIFGEPLFLPFSSAPLSHWVHLSAPPPGPHTPLVAVRLAGIDRCLAVDAKGIFHFFRWAWRNDELPLPTSSKTSYFDSGCFVAQRELPRFRTVPRLMYFDHSNNTPAVAISKTLFANRSVLLVLSNGDNHGSISMQLVDPAKGEVRGNVLVPHVHAARITCIATDAIGTAAGHGGIGGELALVGSADGNASLWRFMSSHFLPLRPRLRLQGHQGNKIVAVALCSTIHVAVTLSARKCCIHSLGNGTLSRTFGPPDESFDIAGGEDIRFTTVFADSSALAVSVQGFVIAVCETTIHSSNLPYRKIVSLNLFSIEGVFLGSTPLESWRGVPHKLYCTPDGTTVMVCCGRGVTMHRLSAWQPLKFLDEFQVTESDDFGPSLSSAWDLDLGPALNRPVVAVAACSNGALRLHALPGISVWSERNKKSGLTQTVGIALATPARRISSVVRDGIGFGRQLAGMGRDIQREVTTDVKERGVGGFLGSVMSRMNGTNK